MIPGISCAMYKLANIFIIRTKVNAMVHEYEMTCKTKFNYKIC